MSTIVCRHTTTWVAGGDAPKSGVLRLEASGELAVRDGDEVVWRSAWPSVAALSLRITDEGDGLMINWIGLPCYSLLHGPIEPTSLGSSAPVSALAVGTMLRTDNGKHTVIRRPDGCLEHERSLGPGASWVQIITPDEVRSLDRPGTQLTWRFIKNSGPGQWKLVLVDGRDEVRWVQGEGDVSTQVHSSDIVVSDLPGSPVVASGPFVSDGPYSSEWMDEGLGMDDVYCVTAIRDVTPDEALRRFGASDDEISTATWSELLDRAAFEEADEEIIVAAFAIGPHTLLVEDNGWQGVNRPDLSVGTFAVASYCSINADVGFVVSRDGVVLATLDENAPSSAEGADPGVLSGPLSEMGITDPEAFDRDDDNFLEDLELLCRLAGIRPKPADVTGPARVAIFGSQY